MIDPILGLYIFAALGGVAATISGLAAYFGVRQLKKQKIVSEPTTLQIDLDSVHKAIDALPNKVLQSIVSKNNNHRGDMGELVSFLKLSSIYDRVIPINNLTDFIGIKLPTETSEGSIDFIDVKTGKATLSKEQKALRKLIEDKKINFVKFKVDINIGPDSGDSNP